MMREMLELIWQAPPPRRRWWQFWRPRLVLVTPQAELPVERGSVRRAIHTRRHFGAKYYLGDILDRLDSAFEDMRVIRRADPEAFGMIRNGAASIVDNDFVATDEVNLHWLERLPTFAAAYENRSEQTKVIWKGEDRYKPTFCYAIKQGRRRALRTNIQPAPPASTTYRCGLVYWHKDKEYPLLAQYCVAVTRDRRIVPLKLSLSREQLIPSKHDGPNRCDSAVKHHVWDWDPYFKDVAIDNDVSPEDLTLECFRFITNSTIASETGMTVRVRKGTAVISFAIDMLRTPYFFADRDKTVTVNGRTHKILHVVRPHLRIGPDGRRHIVRMHFRGLRKFKWNGYSVSIGIAGWHGVAFSDFGIDPVDEEKAAKLREEGHTLLSAAGATAMIEKHQV